ncbi:MULTISPECIES: glycine betaine/L-proline ABC transporter ATP-binding protein [Thalassospira]|uniref:Quaternary amine transport ATP-binding protein n=1 Tax=Thalassospira profundimaris TaxID=502049 RepID=A0A367VCM8_9PROT|nr:MULTISPECIES: glycine betaine/L-proline ABC transporter ATP-binding protein [Thalassospira]KZB73082.1 glycine/betaine ABC transporter [Thalassospira sp. MCCC 1A01148]RCK22913.1 glycine/betaine ABC transporter [Thalassospira profundimaris]
MSYIEIRNIFKIFGPDPQSALELAKGGSDKDEILAKTGHTVGLHDVSLSIEQGETFVVMGLSGSGKSTLIRHLNRLIDPTAGCISFGGEDILAMDIPTLNAFRRKRLGMVFQRFGLLPHRNVMDNVAYGLEIQGTVRKEREAAASKWIERVGLAGYETKYPDQLSGGMQQRVGLARALATDPEVLLMDEAFSALDPLIRSDMQDELMKLQAELHKTIVFITHDLDEALKIGDRIAILKDGKLVQVGRPEEIVLRPADDYVQAFTRDVNRSRVLRAKSIMEPINSGESQAVREDWPSIQAHARLADILPVALANGTSMTVRDAKDTPIGTLSPQQIVDALES